MNRDLHIPPIVDERLREWGRCFRNKKQWQTCASIEKKFQPHSEDFATEGWGDIETAPSPPPLRAGAMLDAIETNQIVMGLDRVQKWTLTYHFCYPGLPRFVILKALKKHANRRLNWTQYREQVDLGRMRVYCALNGNI